MHYNLNWARKDVVSFKRPTTYSFSRLHKNAQQTVLMRKYIGGQHTSLRPRQLRQCQKWYNLLMDLSPSCRTMCTRSMSKTVT